MKKKMLSIALAVSMMVPTLSTAVFAQNNEPENFSELPADDDIQTEAAGDMSKAGVNVPAPLTLQTYVNGQPESVLPYNPSNTAPYEIQVGGDLDMEGVGRAYRNFKYVYVTATKHDISEFNSKVMTASFTYQFSVNPNVVTVNTDVVTVPENWQKAFEKEIQPGDTATENFFSFMKCTDATYTVNEAGDVGTVTVTFQAQRTVNGKTTNDVLMQTFEPSFAGEDQAPTVHALSPEGAFTISQENSAKAATAVYGDQTSFSGNVDMSTHLTPLIKNIFFPIKFVSQPDHTGLTLAGTTNTPTPPTTPGGGSGSGSGSGGGSAVTKTVDLYRLYNPNSGEHFYTQNVVEKDHLVKVGWDFEGIGWTSPTTSNYPVYRLYNPNAGDHHFTMMANERDELTKVGWKYEGISWYSLPANQGVKVYREYNPNAKMAGAHNYTTSKAENDYLISIGWLDEGVGWWASAAGKPAK